MNYKWVVLGTCCLISLYVSGTIQIGFTSLIEPLVREFGWSYTQISFAASLRGLETGLMVPIAGLIMDRWGPHRLVLGGCLIGGFGLLSLSRVNSLAMFYVSFIFLAIGVSSVASNLLMAMVSRWFEKNAGMAMGIAASGVAFGGLLLPLITRFIDHCGWRHTVFIMGLGMWIFILPLSWLLRRRPDRIKPPAANQRQADFRHFVEKDQNAGPALGRSTITALKSRPFWVIAGVLLCHVLTVNAITTHIMPYLSSIHFSRADASFFASSLSILTVFGRVGFGWLADRCNKRNLAVAAFGMTTLAALILSFAGPDRIWVMVLFSILLGIGWGGAVPMTSTLVIAYFGKNHVASILGFVSGLMTVGMVLGAPLAGWIYDRWGDYSPAWFAISALMLTATLVFIWLLPPVNRQY